MLARSVWWCCKSNNITSRYFCPLLPPYHLLFVSVSKINQLLMTILILGGFKNHEGSKLTGSTSRCWDTSCVLNCSERWPWLVAHDLRMTTNQRHRMFFLCHWINFKSRTSWFPQIYYRNYKEHVNYIAFFPTSIMYFYSIVSQQRMKFSLSRLLNHLVLMKRKRTCSLLYL